MVMIRLFAYKSQCHLRGLAEAARKSQTLTGNVECCSVIADADYGQAESHICGSLRIEYLHRNVSLVALQ